MSKALDSKKLHYAWAVLAVGTFVVFGALGLARFGYSLLLPSMQSALDLDNSGAGVLATVNLAGYLLLALAGGALAARFGPRLVVSLGMLCVGIAMLFTGSANSYFSAVLWRTVTGVGSGASNVPVMSLMSAWFGPDLRGLATGIAATGSSIALIVTGPLVPRLLTAVPDGGWRVTWYVFGGFSLVIAALSAALLRNEPAKIGLGPVRRRPSALDRYEEKPEASGKRVKLQWSLVYHSKAVWHLGAVYAAFGFSYIIYITFFVRYLVGEAGYTGQGAGNLFMLLGWCSLVCGLLWSGLSDRIGRKNAMALVFAIHTVSFLLFALWQKRAGYTISAVLFGISAWSIPAIMAAACGDVVGHRLAPAALGFVTLFFSIGQAAGPWIAGAIADATGSFKGSFLLAAVVAFLGCVGTLLLKPVGNNEMPVGGARAGSDI
jgi:sugar phosphate permease